MGLFITFEGIEGCGKSTQSKALKNRFARREVPVLLVREPGSTAVGQVARRLLKHKLEIELDPMTELLLFEVARAQLVAEVIRPALKENKTVICDRYCESTLAYQGYGRGLDLEIIRQMNQVATGGLQPDLIILPDIDVEEGLRRKGEASVNDRFEREQVSFHQRVRDGYLDMAQADMARWVVIDATLPKKEMGKLIWERVRHL